MRSGSQDRSVSLSPTNSYRYMTDKEIEKREEKKRMKANDGDIVSTNRDRDIHLGSNDLQDGNENIDRYQEEDDEHEPISLQEMNAKIGFGYYQIVLLIVCGLGFCADAMEISLISFISCPVSIEFNQGKAGETLLTMAIFGGELAGTLISGPISDMYGRRVSWAISLLLMVVGGIFSATVSSFEELLLFRCLAGIGIGGSAAPYDLIMESTPTEYRGKLLLFLQSFWTVGACAVVLLAWWFLEDITVINFTWLGLGELEVGGWRWVTGLSSFPVIIAFFSIFWLPESPRWLYEKEQYEKA